MPLWARLLSAWAHYSNSHVQCYAVGIIYDNTRLFARLPHNRVMFSALRFMDMMNFSFYVLLLYNTQKDHIYLVPCLSCT